MLKTYIKNTAQQSSWPDTLNDVFHQSNEGQRKTVFMFTHYYNWNNTVKYNNSLYHSINIYNS